MVTEITMISDSVAGITTISDTTMVAEITMINHPTMVAEITTINHPTMVKEITTINHPTMVTDITTITIAITSVPSGQISSWTSTSRPQTHTAILLLL